MEDPQQFDTHVRLALARYGIAVDDVELAVMRAAEDVYGPPRDAMLGADLSAVPPEHDLDPSRAPRVFQARAPEATS
jgi:hypothetical protein